MFCKGAKKILGNSHSEVLSRLVDQERRHMLASIENLRDFMRNNREHQHYVAIVGAIHHIVETKPPFMILESLQDYVANYLDDDLTLAINRN